MNQYQRMVSYLYEYKKGVKGENVGYVRIERRGAGCRISLQMRSRNLGQLSDVAVFRQGAEGIRCYTIGALTERNGDYRCRIETESENLIDSGINISDVDGIILYQDDTYYVATTWKNQSIRVGKSRIWDPAEPEDPMEPDSVTMDGELAEPEEVADADQIALEQNNLDSGKSVRKQNLQGESNADSNVAMVLAEGEEQQEGNNAENLEQQTLQQDGRVGFSERSEVRKREQNDFNRREDRRGEQDGFRREDRRGDQNDFRREDRQGDRDDFRREDRQGDQDDFRREDRRGDQKDFKREGHQEGQSDFNGRENRQETVEFSEENGKRQEMPQMGQRFPRWGGMPFFRRRPAGNTNIPIPQMGEWSNGSRHMADSRKAGYNENSESKMKVTDQEKDVSRTSQESKQQIEEEAVCRNCPFKRRGIDYGKRILMTFPIMRPFPDNQQLACVRIEPQDLGCLPMQMWTLANNHFLLQGYYCYRHLIFMETEKGGYALGVPGIYDRRTCRQAEQCGFSRFRAICGGKQCEGAFGYWIMPLSCL